MGTRGGSSQELYRQMALKLGRDGADKRPAQPGQANLQRDAEQRAVAGGTKKPTGARGKAKV